MAAARSHPSGSANGSDDKVYWYRALQIILIKSGRMLVELSPYVVLGVVASQALRYTKLTAAVQRACSGAPFVSVLLAAVLGLVSPLCTYGTVPVVQATGGLADTVVEASTEPTGFVFYGLAADDLLFALERAVLAFRDRARWETLVARCMAQDFSWTESARKYADLYETAVARHGGRT